jgi:hypothetical protein
VLWSFLVNPSKKFLSRIKPYVFHCDRATLKTN